MREIKFRGKIEDGRWVFGYLEIIQGCSSVNYIIHSFSDWNLNTSFEVIPETVGQFTGLKDKNGKEIYEGDIYKDKLHGLRVIKYTDRMACFMSYLLKDETLGNPIHFENRAIIEIIGNIYENSHLLDK